MQKHKPNDRLKELNLKTFHNLIEKRPSDGESSPTSDLLLRQRILRVLTCMEINYCLYAYFYLLEKCTKIKVEELKVGVIGCGAMGRLILNTLLILSKEGLNTANITVSTRQPELLELYSKHFQVGLVFDNERVMEQSDIVFVATPATLDNWILVDLKESYDKRCAKQAYPRPLVFVLTSNIDDRKCANTLSSHILLPSVNHQSTEEFLTTHGWYRASDNQQREQILQDFLYKKLLGRVADIYNTMCYVFLNWEMTVKTEDGIEAAAHEHAYACFKKPSTEQCYRQRCKRWRSALMNFEERT